MEFLILGLALLPFLIWGLSKRREKLLHEEEFAMLSEMNFARTRPKEYINKRLNDKYIRSVKKSNFNDIDVVLKDIETLKKELLNYAPTFPLKWSKGCYQSAYEWAEFQRDNSAFYHGEVLKRIQKYCSPGKNACSCGENLSLGLDNDKAVNSIRQLLIDAGFEGYGHRKNILGTTKEASVFTHAGCVIMKHPKDMYVVESGAKIPLFYRIFKRGCYQTVTNFSCGFKTKEPPIDNNK